MAPPRHEPTGTTQIPLSRVRKIINLDPDIHMCSNAASVLITLATELFIQHLAEQSHTIVKSERKPRRNIQYRDVSATIHRADNLEFLADLVPKTVPFKEIKERKAVASTSMGKMNNGEGSSSRNALIQGGTESGQTTLGGVRGTEGDVIGKGKGKGRTSILNGEENGDGVLGVHGMVEHGVAGPAGGQDMDDDSTLADPNEQLRMESRGANTRISNGSSVATDGRLRSEDVEME